MTDRFGDKIKIEQQFIHGALIGGVYKVLEFIGEGGMGLVYKVEHTLMHKEMAIKVLKAEYLSEAVWNRFRKEAQAIARLDHINVIKIYDMNQTADGRPYYTMDLLAGQSLDHYLKQNQRLPLEDALPIFRQVCAGLTYAHDHGVIHRDIKPGNIMLLKGSNVKIVDFGIAKLVDDGGQTIQGVTKPGEIFGSPLYMSPEQCHGSKLDARADIYSLGVTIYHALTGLPPLVGRSAIETTMLHHSQAAPLLREKAPDLEFPQKLEIMVAKMLAKLPGERYSNLSEVATELLAMERGLVNHAPSTVSYANLQHADANKIDTHGTTTAGKKLQSLLTIIGLLAATVVAGLMLVLTLPKAANEKAAMPKIATVTTIAPAFGVLEDTDDSDLAAVDDYLRGGGQFFAKIKNLPGKNRNFVFPSKFSLGNFTFDATKPGAEREFEARGTVEVPAGCELGLVANDNTKARPELLQFFRPDDLTQLKVEKLHVRNAKLSQHVSRLRSLVHLEMAGSSLNDSDMTLLEKLNNLKTFTVGGTSIDGKRLARSKILSGLYILSVADLKNVSPVLQALSGFRRVLSINLNNTQITKPDIKTLSAMTQLEKLWLRATAVDDADIETLSRLSNLQYINLEDCASLTPNCITSLRKFKKLNDLELPSGIVTQQNLKSLLKDRPLIKKVRPPVTADQ